MPSTLFVILFIIWLPVVALATNDSHLRGIRAIQSQTAVPKPATMFPFRIFVNAYSRLLGQLPNPGWRTVLLCNRRKCRQDSEIRFAHRRATKIGMMANRPSAMRYTSIIC